MIANDVTEIDVEPRVGDDAQGEDEEQDAEDGPDGEYPGADLRVMVSKQGNTQRQVPRCHVSRAAVSARPTMNPPTWAK